MKSKSKKVLGLCLLFSALVGCAHTTPPPNVQVCTAINDPTDILVENPTGYCKNTMSTFEKTIEGDSWKEKVKTGVIMSMDDWIKLNVWVKSICRQTENACQDIK